MMRFAYIIITCGNRKRPHPAPASRLYTGTFFKKQLQTALALKPREAVLIHSSKHGYLPLDQRIEPYENRIGEAQTLSLTDLAKQAQALTLHPDDHVMLLGAKGYAALTKQVMPDYVNLYWAPKLLTDRRIGYQGQLYSAMAKPGRIRQRHLDQMKF